jgi:DNA polymerase-3 subunit epsilon
VPRLPAGLDPSIADELPESPGVYLIYGENDALLHVGKAKNLATRALSHFGEPRTPRERVLQAQARRIEWIETAGEFGALVTEARFVKEQKPLLNRRRRATAEHWTIRLDDDPAASGAIIVPFDPSDDAQGAYGMFRRRGDAERALAGIAREHQQCLKCLGIEDGEGSCIGYALGRCRGACVGTESLVLHALRARLALSGLKRRDWPFPGRIGIRERDWRGHEEIHVFDRWCHLGVVSSGIDLSECEERPRIFDPDVYRILTGFLDRPIAGAELLRLEGNRSP